MSFTDSKPSGHAATVRRLLLVAVAMFGFGYAMVPLYSVFCEATGLNGKTNSEAASIEGMSADTGRLVTVEFIGSVNGGLPWEFQPTQVKMEVHPGEATTTHYYAHNTSGRETQGQAVPSVAPGQAAEYFRKIECFCFTQQALAPGETREMPVTFVVDPELPEEVSTLTLSYTFFPRPGEVASQRIADGLDSLDVGITAAGHDHHEHPN